MAESKTAKRERPEKPGNALPVGHPQAGYVDPDLSFRENPDAPLPDAEQAWADERDNAREEQVKAVNESEEKAAKEEREQREKELQEETKAAHEALKARGITPPAPSIPSTSSSSSSSKSS